MINQRILSGDSMRSCRLAMPAFVAAMVFLASPLRSEQPTGAAFLKIPVGARAVGMGSAFSALVDDASALYWNPAGIARIGITDILASHNEWIADTRESFVGLAQRLPAGQVLGVSYLTLYMDPLDRRGDKGEKLGTFTAQDRALGLTWAMRLGFLSLGATAKRIEQRLDDAVAEGQAMDFGLQIRPHRRIYFGAALQNVGPPMKYIAVSYKLPTTARAGMGYRLTRTVTLAVEGRQDIASLKKETDFSAGLEYNLAGLDQSYFWSPVVWRVGYLSPSGPGVGLGLKIFGAHLDYALTPMGDLGLTHRASLNLRFGRNRKSSSSAGRIQSETAPGGAKKIRATKSSEDETADGVRDKKKTTKKKKKKGVKTGTIFDMLFRR
ncbi:MAG: PorV/PorQ family protein [Elusimicrobia bacterium]|nr:PorV/PorQ family protein [Elusimicrobiota bacterium]